MFKNGMHMLVIYLTCIDHLSHIHLSSSQTTFTINNFTGDQTSGTACLELHSHIDFFEKSNGFTCTRFAYVIQGSALSSSLCVSNLRFLQKIRVGSSRCSKCWVYKLLIWRVAIFACFMCRDGDERVMFTIPATDRDETLEIYM